MTRCSNCQRPMRPFRALKADYPGTVSRSTNDTCSSCYAKRGGQRPDIHPAEVVDAPCVLVRTDLRPSTYQILAQYAHEHHVEVGEVVSLLLDRAVQKPEPKPRQRPERVEDDTDREIRRLNAEGKSDAEISAEIGLGIPTVWRRRKRLNLRSPRERALAVAS